MNKLMESLQNTLGESLPGVIGALVILIVGWIVALIIKAALQKGLSAAKLNERLSKGKENSLNLESGIAQGGYYIVMLMALIAVFNQLGLEIAAQPIQALLTQVMEYIPKIIGGAVLVLVAWLCGTIARQVLSAALKSAGADEKLGSAEKPFSQTIGEVAYWLVILMFLPGILAVFGIQGLLQPAQSMLDKIMGMLPNIFAAAIIGFAGWFVAKILRDIISNLLSAAGTDKLGEKAGVKKLSALVGTIVYFLTIVPAIIAALNALEISAIADPATSMLNSIMAMVPNILGATAIVVITYFVAKPVSGIIGDLLKSSGANQLPQKMGLAKADVSLSQYAGKGVFFFMMLFAAVEATNQLQLAQLSG
ncbi:MAG: mechanosensitive ion channel, partial [Candidatus Omnitrophica bacterium]|nr:mechanosensitive ion channel [Candidatus Omnitrophota bacterium]